MKLVVCSMLIGAAVFCGVGAAQTVSGTIAGNVTDATGAFVPKVEIKAKSEQTDLARSSVTNSEGYYLLTFLPPGSYELTVTVRGFQTIVKKGVGVDLNRTTPSDFVLKPSAVTTTVEVTGETPIIEMAQGDVKHTITEKEIEDIPLAGRNVLSLVEQIPGFQNAPWIGSSNNPTNSTGSYAAFNGMGSRSTTFQIDGVNNDDSSENQNRQNVNIATIKEVQVLTNSFSAEFGRSAGAVMQVQTKSGTNQIHGDAYDYMQSDSFNANTFFANQLGRPKGAVDRNNYGWVVHGPIKKNKLFILHSGDRTRNVGTSSITRFIWLPSDTPHVCGPGETSKPGGPYCLDPATHPNSARDIAFMKNVMGLWNTDELKGKPPNDPVACADMISSGRPNRCVTIDGVGSSLPQSDYTGKVDWIAPLNTTLALRYQYSRQSTNSGRIIAGDNFGITNNRQYNIGLTATHVYSPRQTGEFRFGFGNRTTLQDVVDGNNIPTLRFSSTLYTGVDGIPGTVIGTSTNVPINRRQHDLQLVYNHTIVFSKHTLKAGVDVRKLLLDDITGDRSRGFWTFGTQDTLASIRALTGYTGWENFLRGFDTSFQEGFGNPVAQNRYNEGNLWMQDDLRLTHSLKLNFGARWEGVGAPHEIQNRFSYGFSGDYNNFEPRLGFSWTPVAKTSWLRHITGERNTFVIKGGYGLYHGRMFQSIFSQNQLSLRTQPPNGFARDFSGLCSNEISDPSCGFVFTPGVATYSTASQGGGVFVKGGEQQSTLLIPDPGLHLNYTQQWNLAIARNITKNTAIEITYNGNRGIGNPFYDSTNDARFPIASPLVTVDVGNGNLQPLLFDRVCRDASDPICQAFDAAGNLTVNSSGTLKTFSALASTTATLAQKGIVIENGVPHGYVSLGTMRLNERRPDPTQVRDALLRNFGWNYYHGLIAKVTKRYSRGLWFTASWTFSKAIDTGSEQTFTGVDTNAPSGKNNAARSLRGLSSYDARHAVILSYGYELPWMRRQKGIVGRIAGGWVVSGTTSFRSGTPYSVLLGYDANLDGLGSDRPSILDPTYLYRSVDNGRAQSPCPTVVAVGPCPDTKSQLQLPGNVFLPNQAGTIGAEQRLILVGTDGRGTIGRNTFLTQGQNNFDTRFTKTVTIREKMKLSVQMEFYNLMNRVTFDVPTRTILSSNPLGRITSTRNVNGFVGSGRTGGARAGQLVVRFSF